MTSHPPFPNTRPLRVLGIVQCTNLGGMEQTASTQAQLMVRRHGIRYRFISPRQAGPGSQLFRAIDPDMSFFDYRGRFNLHGHRPFAQEVARLAEDADLIYVIGTCVSSLRAALATKLPVILAHHYHHGDDWRMRMKWRLFYRFFARRLKGVIYISPFTRSEALDIAPNLSGKAFFARQAISLSAESTDQKRDAARSKLSLPPNAFIIGNAGWLIERKRFDVFLNVAAQVSSKIDNVFFEICGDGPQRTQLETLSRRLGIADRVRFTGWIDNLDDHYTAWDVNLFNTDFDAVGRTALEAIARDCNVIASVRYGGLPEFFATGERGVCFREHDIPAMTNAILAIYRDPDRARDERMAARAHLAATYTKENAIGPIEALFFDRDHTDRR